MRLISQDGKIDIPYENSVVHAHSIHGYNREEHRIITPMGDDTWLLGDYSTEEKALKVMSKLREDWKDDLAFFYFPADEEVEV